MYAQQGVYVYVRLRHLTNYIHPSSTSVSTELVGRSILTMARFARWDEITADQLRKACDYMGYPFFTTGDYNLNIFGIRSNDKDSNMFNDVVGLVYKVDGNWVCKKYEATTDPGTYWRQNLMNVNGTAIIKPGFYKSVWHVGMHKGQYKALTQVNNFTVWRDNNKDSKLDFGRKEETGVFGCNLHRATPNAGQKSTYVDKWSAGCQVIAANNDFRELMSIVDKAAKLYGSTFSYKLFTEANFFCESKSVYPV